MHGAAQTMKLELVVIPVSDVDRATSFYIEKAGFNLHVDHRAGGDGGVVRMTPPGSACSIAIMKNEQAAGALDGLQLVVPDIDAARAELADRGANVSEIFHFEEGGRVSGPDPQRRDHGSCVSFKDPDGNGWLVQEVSRPVGAGVNTAPM